MEEKQFTAEELAANESFIAYYLKSDIESVSYWQHWISLHPDQIDEVQNAEQLLDLLHFRLPQHELDNERARLTDFISSHTRLPAQTPNPLPQSNFKLYNYIKIAAVLAVLTAFGFYFFPSLRTKDNEKTAITWSAFTSPARQRTTIRLSDGTVVTLNAGSTLCYPKTFSTGERLVKLTGEAFFEVSHDAAHPFVVNTGKVNTRVLGTAFNVSGDPAENNISVALIRGSVKIEITDQSKRSMLLKPGERLQYNRLSGQMQKGTFDEATEAGWKNGLIVFKAADFNSIAGTFHRNYGYTLINYSSSKKLNYTGRFANQTPVQIIKAICFSLDINYKIQNDTIILSNN